MHRITLQKAVKVYIFTKSKTKFLSQNPFLQNLKPVTSICLILAKYFKKNYYFWVRNSTS